MSIFFGLFGYLVPLVHLVKFVKDILPDVDGKALLLCMQFASLVARMVFGKVSDFKLIRSNRVLLQQVMPTQHQRRAHSILRLFFSCPSL